jgi:hypothetical protein
MENLFPLIFIVIALLSIIGKLKKRPRAPETKASEVGWIQKLNALLADVQQRLQQPPQDGASGQSPWERLLKGADLSGSQPDGPAARDVEPVADAVTGSPRPARNRPMAPVRATVAARMDKTAPVVTAVRTPAAAFAKGSVSSLRGRRADLRNAVVWSEILGPPVALKDKRR